MLPLKTTIRDNLHLAMDIFLVVNSLPDLVIRKRKRDPLVLLAEKKVKHPKRLLVRLRKKSTSKDLRNLVLLLRRTYLLRLKQKRDLKIARSRKVNRNLPTKSPLVLSPPPL